MGMQYSRGLIAGYPFENSGADIVGVNNGTVYGATYVDGQCGRALSFDGINDYVELPLINLPIMSISAKVKFENVAQDMSIVCKDSRVPNRSYQFRTSGTELLVVLFTPDGTFISETTGVNIKTNIWRHVAFTYDGANIRIYADGLLRITTPCTGDIASNELTPKIGRINTTTQTWAKGLIDNVQIFNRALTVNEIKRLYLNLGI